MNFNFNFDTNLGKGTQTSLAKMKIITLTSDMGLIDHYVALIKGTILSLDPDVNIVDISHQIQPFDLMQASHVLGSCFESFPKGTIHIQSVLSEPMLHGPEPEYPSILKFKDHYFVGNNNGFFSLLANHEEVQGFWTIDNILSNPKASTFTSKNIFVSVAVKLAQGVDPNEIAAQNEHEINKKIVGLPTIKENVVIGRVVHVDIYGNLITNLDRSIFDQRKGIPFTIYVRSNSYFFEEIHSSYNDVPPGERVAIFNDSGFVELAINRGSNQGNGGASMLMSVKRNDSVNVQFSPRGSAENLNSLF